MSSAAGMILRGLTCGAALMAGSPASAETKCEVKVQTCIDVRGGARICQVTICKDELGNIVSTDVVVFKDADAGSPAATPGPKLRAPRVEVQELKRN